VPELFLPAFIPIHPYTRGRDYAVIKTPDIISLPARAGMRYYSGNYAARGLIGRLQLRRRGCRLHRRRVLDGTRGAASRTAPILRPNIFQSPTPADVGRVYFIFLQLNFSEHR